MLIDKELFPDENGNGKYRSNSDSMICDINCFDTFYDSLFVSDVNTIQNVEQKTPEKCYEVHKYAPHMFSLVCKNILRSNYNNKGLLHSLEDVQKSEDNTSEINAAEVNILLSKCVENSDLNLRESAAMELIEILAGDEEEDENDNGGEDTDDNDEDGDDSIPDGTGHDDINDEGGEVSKDDNEHIGDEDLGEDQYEKSHDLLTPRKKKSQGDIGDQGNLKYDLNDFDDDMLIRRKKQKDVQFP